MALITRFDQILEKFGYKGIDTADDGRAAVAAAEKVDYDLILMDLQVGVSLRQDVCFLPDSAFRSQMPTMDGYTARNVIYQKDPANCPVIVALTANTDEVGPPSFVWKTGYADKHTILSRKPRSAARKKGSSTSCQNPSR
jgi:CheY-like chemotaxis protein